MRRFFSVLSAILTAVVLLAACGTPPEELPDTGATGPVTATLGQAVPVEDWTISLDKTAVEDGLLKAYFTIDATNSINGATMRLRSFTATTADGKTGLDRSITCSIMPTNIDAKTKLTGTDAAQCWSLNSPNDAKGAVIKYTLANRSITWNLP